MTSKERDALDCLRTELHGYHGEVKAIGQLVQSTVQEVARHSLDLYGNPEDRTGNPGLLASYEDLRKGRKMLLSVVAGAWTLATLLLGSLASRLF